MIFFKLHAAKSCYNVTKLNLVASVDSGTGTTGVKCHNDGVDTSSLNVLLQWLTAEGNYNNYRGASDSGGPLSEGKTKDNYCTEISDLIKRARIKVERTKNAVRAKINEIKATYCKAKDWNNNTGAGVECQITLQNYVKTLRPYYYDVHEVCSVVRVMFHTILPIRTK
jgi:hypothetical protein